MSPREGAGGDGVVTVVQARVASSRLPGKVLLPLGRRTVLECLLERLERSLLKGTVVVATTVDQADEAVARACLRAGAYCYRGHPTDLLDRLYRVGLAYGAQHIVKLSAACPLIDPHVVDRVLAKHLTDPDAYDFASNLRPPSYPEGNDVEVVNFRTVATAWSEARKPHEREHITPFLWKQPERFRSANVVFDSDTLKTHRIALDYPADYQVIRRVYDALHGCPEEFGVDEIVDFLEEHPEAAAINARYLGARWYREHQADVRKLIVSRKRADVAENVVPEREPETREPRMRDEIAFNASRHVRRATATSDVHDGGKIRARPQ